MNTVLRGFLYLVLLGVTAFFFGRFRLAYNAADLRGAALEAVDAASTNDAPAEVTPGATGAESTNEPAGPAGAPNLAEPSALATSAPAATNGAKAAAVGTNVAGRTTNTAAAPRATRGKTPPPELRRSQAGGYLAGFVLSLLALAGIAGWDVTQWFAGRTSRGMGAEAETVEPDPEYDAAEAEWANGNHLEAITLMREYLQKNPGEQHVAIRIAEIYEKDLANYLAAALELEEVLGHRIAREKWGWTAIHLANLYSGKLNQPPKAVAVLERIVTEYPDTAAARKARQRLGIPEPMAVATGAAGGGPAPAEGDEAAAEPAPDDPNLPQGFRAKKR